MTWIRHNQSECHKNKSESPKLESTKKKNHPNQMNQNRDNQKNQFIPIESN